MGVISDDEIIMYVDFVLSFMVPPLRLRNQTPNYQFSDRQKKILRAVVNCSAYWTTTTLLTWPRTPREQRTLIVNLDNSNSRMLGEELGLPSTREGLKAFLDQID